MQWIRVDTDRPSRLQAPSSHSAAQRSLEGIDKLFQAPLNMRGISTTAPSSAESSVALHNAVVFNFPNEEKLGTVAVACGGEHATDAACAAVAMTALTCMRSCNSQTAQAVCDFLCQTNEGVSEEAEITSTALDDEADGLVRIQAAAETTTKNRSFLPGGASSSIPVAVSSKLMTSANSRSVVAATATNPGTADALKFRKSEGVTSARRLVGHLLTFGTVPLSCIFCSWVVSNSAPNGVSPAALLTSPSLSALKNDIKGSGEQSLVKQLALKRTLSQSSLHMNRLWHHIQSSIAAASGVASGGGFDERLLLGPTCPSTHFGAVFSSTGLAASSQHFFDVTTHWERLVLSAIAMEHLLLDPQHQSEVIRSTEQPFRLSSSKAVAQLVVVSVGRCLSFVVAFRFAKKSPLLPIECPVAASDYVRVVASAARDVSSKRTSGESEAHHAAATAEQAPPVLDAMLSRSGQHARVGKYKAACTDLQLAGIGGSVITSSDEEDDTTMCGCVTRGGSSQQKQKKKRETALAAESTLPFGFALCKYSVKIRRAETSLFSDLCRLDKSFPLQAHVATLSSVPVSARSAARDSNPHSASDMCVAEYTSRVAFVTMYAKSIASTEASRRVIDALQCIDDVLDRTEEHAEMVCAMQHEIDEELLDPRSAGGVSFCQGSGGEAASTLIADRRVSRAELHLSLGKDAACTAHVDTMNAMVVRGDIADDLALDNADAEEHQGGSSVNVISRVLRLHSSSVLKSALQLCLGAGTAASE